MKLAHLFAHVILSAEAYEQLHRRHPIAQNVEGDFLQQNWGTGQTARQHVTGEYPPKAPPYAWWAPTYGDLAPTEVCDVCGGFPGVTKWAEIPEPCAIWTVTMLRCAQVCNNSNRFEGFGQCMDNCGVTRPVPDNCRAPNLATDISNYCSNTNAKWRACRCAERKYGSSDEWMTCIHTCVYDCGPSLQLELDLGFDITWRDRKCPLLFFACGGEGSTKCTQMKACNGVWEQDCKEKVCAPPVGTGLTECFFDDPFCGARSQENAVGLSDQCVLPRKEGAPCAKYPLWVAAKSYPVCAEDLACSSETGFCEDLCADNCSSHGACETSTGECTCNAGRMGDRCEGEEPPPPPPPKNETMEGEATEGGEEPKANAASDVSFFVRPHRHDNHMHKKSI